MSTENEKELDDFLRQLTKDVPLEEPNDQFTAGVLSTIKTATSLNSAKVHAPVFSRASWVLIIFLASVLLILGYGYREQQTMLPGFFSFLRKTSNSDVMVHLPNLGSSNILVFSFLALLGAVAFQIVWLKKSWAKKRVVF